MGHGLKLLWVLSEAQGSVYATREDRPLRTCFSVFNKYTIITVILGEMVREASLDIIYLYLIYLFKGF